MEWVSESTFSSKSSQHHKPQTVRAKMLNFDGPHHVSHVMCQVSHVTFFFYKEVELVGKIRFKTFPMFKLLLFSSSFDLGIKFFLIWEVSLLVLLDINWTEERPLCNTVSSFLKDLTRYTKNRMRRTCKMPFLDNNHMAQFSFNKRELIKVWNNPIVVHNSRFQVLLKCFKCTFRKEKLGSY